MTVWFLILACIVTQKQEKYTLSYSKSEIMAFDSKNACLAKARAPQMAECKIACVRGIK